MFLLENVSFTVEGKDYLSGQEMNRQSRFLPFRYPCPAKGRKCAKSLKYGHFASCWKGIIFRWKVVKTANRKELATAKKELEDRQTKWEVTPSRTGEESICICCSGGSTRGGVYGVDFKRVYDECEYRWFCSGSVDWFTISE